MIPKNFVTQWKKHAPWNSDAHVEQDLLICRILVDLFNDPYIAERLCYRCLRR